MLFEIIFSFAFLAFLIFLIRKMKLFAVEGLSKKLIIIIFLIKVVCGVGLWALYTYYYTDRATADIYKYFDDSNVIFGAIHDKPMDYFQMVTGLFSDKDYFQEHYFSNTRNWTRDSDQFFGENQLIIRLNAIIQLFSMEIYHVHMLVFCFLSLIGQIFIFKLFYPSVKKIKNLLIAFVFLFPSVLFWNSGVLKEPLLIFLLGIFIYYLHKPERRISKIVILFFTFLFLLFTKLYVASIFIPLLIAHVLVEKINASKMLVIYLGVLLLLISTLLSLKHFTKWDILANLAKKQNEFIIHASGGVYLIHDSLVPYIPPENINLLIEVDSIHYKIKQGSNFMYWKFGVRDTLYQTNYQDTTTFSVFAQSKKAGSLIKMEHLKPTLGSFIKNIPKAISNCILRPCPLENKSPLMMLSSAENYFTILFLIICIYFRKKTIPQKNLFWFCIFFTLSLFILSGLITPVIGAIVRYKMPALILFLPSLLLILDREKLLTKIPFLKKYIV